ncbi:MAG TPA: YceI family protein [Crocinitomix sp.]|nr:YceI family protein [Crocinitomix sp.]
MKNLFYTFVFSGLLFSCTEEVNTDTPVVAETVEDVIIVNTFKIDTANTVITWTGYEEINVDTPDFHTGTVKALDGSFEITEVNGEKSISNASLTVDMNSIKESEDVTKLETHLKSPDFFDVNQFATTKFIYDKFENGKLYGRISVIGTELPLEAEVEFIETENGITVKTQPFKIDFKSSNMPFFVEDAKQPIEKQHDPVLEFSLEVVGVTE